MSIHALRRRCQRSGPCPFAPRIVLVVYAPLGLDEKRLTNLVTKDENMASALADYADPRPGLEIGIGTGSGDGSRDADDDAQPTSPARPLTHRPSKPFSRWCGR